MYFHVIPYKKGSDILLDPELKLKHEFTEEETAEIYAIEAVPVYKAVIGIE